MHDHMSYYTLMSCGYNTYPVLLKIWQSWTKQQITTSNGKHSMYTVCT